LSTTIPRPSGWTLRFKNEGALKKSIQGFQDTVTLMFPTKICFSGHFALKQAMNDAKIIALCTLSLNISAPRQKFKNLAGKFHGIK